MLESGFKLVHFTIIRRLGVGGMGEVYLAEDEKLKRNVAIKILVAEYFDDTERRGRFYREARTAAGISHPNVTGIHEINSAPDPKTGEAINFIVMEYVEGQSLTTYLEQHGREMSLIVKLAEKTASGLAAAHKLNIVHRDIKPDNIIIDQNAEPKILDFGLAKPVSPVQMSGDNDITDEISKNLTKAGKIVGTVSYMSPEQINGETVDSRSDIFSFGILLYRMCTGNSPFQGDTQVSTLAKILETNPEPPHTKNANIPAELERIIDKCLKKKPDDRYQDTRDLVVDLRNLRRQYESSISGPTPAITEMQQQARPKKSKSNLRFITVSILVAIVAIILTAIIFDKDDMASMPTVRADRNALAILGFSNKTESDEFDWLETGLPEILLTDLSQGQGVTIISRDRILDCLRGEGVDIAAPGLSHPECLKAASKLGARHALSGSFFKFGDNLRIDARVEEIATGKIILAEKVSGSDPFVLVDSLTEKIANLLNLSIETVSGTNVATYTSSSPEAYKKYLEGMKKFELELYDKAIADFKAALAIDSTFALPYMRIAMAHIFNGRQQESFAWFAKASANEDHLPTKERNILDVYIDTWQTRDYDAAFIKMKTLVKNYPDDKETRTIYGLMQEVFTQDTTVTFAQLDTALMLDPHYTLALAQFCRLYRNAGNYEKAREYAERILKFKPDSPTPYTMLAAIYIRQNAYDKAVEKYKELLDIYPDMIDVKFNISNIYIRMHDFENARKYIEDIPGDYSNDPYKMANYYEIMGDLEFWRGKFLSGMEYRHKTMDEYLKTGDSSLISNLYRSISNQFERFHMDDSAIYYSYKAFEWADFLQDIVYPLTLVAVDPQNADTARPYLEKSLETMRSRLPSEMWSIPQYLDRMFSAYAAADTNQMIDTYLELSKSESGGFSNKRAAAFFMVNVGRYKEAADILEEGVYGTQISSSGINHPVVLYHLGVAYDELGKKKEATELFKEMLSYWGKPDLEIREITDARKRLARLIS